MGARTIQGPVKDPENEDQTHPKPAMQGKHGFDIGPFRLNRIRCDPSSLHREATLERYFGNEFITNKFVINQNFLFYVKNIDKSQNT